MAKKEIKPITRVIYGLVGISAAIGGWAIATGFKAALAAGWFPFTTGALLTIGGLNWGVVAITNDRNKDIFGLLKL